MSARREQIGALVARPARAVGGSARRLARRLARGLRAGIPPAVAAAVAAVVLVLILYTVATREERAIRAYTEFTMFPEACALEPTRNHNVVGCQIVGPGVYVLRLSTSLEGSTVVATRGSCCPGRIASSVGRDNRSVVVAIERRVRRPIRASLVAP